MEPALIRNRAAPAARTFKGFEYNVTTSLLGARERSVRVWTERANTELRLVVVRNPSPLKRAGLLHYTRRLDPPRRRPHSSPLTRGLYTRHSRNRQASEHPPRNSLTAEAPMLTSRARISSQLLGPWRARRSRHSSSELRVLPRISFGTRVISRRGS